MSELEEAKRLWDEGKGYEAGILLCKRIGALSSPSWAAHALRLVIEQSGVVHPVLDEVLECAADPAKWSDGHRVFDKVRRQVLKLDEQLRQQKSREAEVMNHVLGLGELVAKVTYNATKPSDEFDEDSGVWLVAVARGFAKVADDAGFEQQMWNAVSTTS